MTSIRHSLGEGGSPDTPRTSSAPPRGAVPFHIALACFALCFGVIAALKAPFVSAPIVYYDDGETLYHAMSTAAGVVPYRENYSHHFLGYILPIMTAGSLFGFSLHTLWLSYCFNQALIGLGVFLVLAFFCSPARALIGALLAVTAREPWVASFFPLYQISALYVWTAYCALRASIRATRRPLDVSFLLCGIAFCCDQRGIFLLILPLACIFHDRRGIGAALRGAIWFGAAPAAAIGWLLSQGAFSAFIEQTVTFPRLFRIGSFGTGHILALGVRAHRYLMELTPILLTFAAIGALGLMRSVRNSAPDRRRSLAIMCGVAIVPPLVTPFPGAREFDYYTVLWLPFLATLAVQAPLAFAPRATALRRFASFALMLPILLSFVPLADGSLRQALRYDDGSKPVIEKLRAALTPEDSLYLWGYRPDIYVALGRLSPYPLMSALFVHPDPEVRDEGERLRHVFPKYEREFIAAMNERPPTYLLLFTVHDGEGEFLGSKSDAAVQSLLADRYRSILRSPGRDVRGVATTFELFRLER